MHCTPRTVVFLDRDGTLIEDPGYLSDPEGVRLLPDVAEGLIQLRNMGYSLVVVSNQSGIARGLISPAAAQAVHQRFVQEFTSRGVSFDAVFYCPHSPDEGCECRKPRPGMLLAGARQLGASLVGSFMVGDRITDLEAGRNAGCQSILLGIANKPPQADLLARDWVELIEVMREVQKRAA